MTQRLWVSGLLALFVSIVSIGKKISEPPFAGRYQLADLDWLQLGLSMPVVLWAGAPWFARSWASLSRRGFDGWTLAAIFAGATWVYSAVATVMPEAFPAAFRASDGRLMVFFEVPALLVTAALLWGKQREPATRCQSEPSRAAKTPELPDQERDRQVQRVILLEGMANGAVLVMKLVVGLATGSVAVMGDAVHSLTDVANNCVAWFIIRLSIRPPDEKHPYGHRKFETVAVFGLATLLTVLAFELASHAIRRKAPEVVHSGWALGLMGCVLLINTGFATWQASRARRLESDLLRADARHTFADVLTTLVVIGGWQAAARGLVWVDTVAALGVTAVILFLAFGLFRRSIPILVDERAIESDSLIEAALRVPGIDRVHDVRSRGHRSHASVEVIAGVAPDLNTVEAHDLATAVEQQIRRDFPRVESVIVHVEPIEPANEE